MNETIVTLVGFVLLAGVVVSPVACTMNRQALIAEAVAKGGDPIAVKCAIESDLGSQPMCVAKAMQAPQK